MLQTTEVFLDLPRMVVFEPVRVITKAWKSTTSAIRSRNVPLQGERGHSATLTLGLPVRVPRMSNRPPRGRFAVAINFTD